MTRLSVNLNKIALIRNSRGSNYPDLIQVAKDCERFEHRHHRTSATGRTALQIHGFSPLKAICTTEFNIEGYPDKHF